MDLGNVLSVVLSFILGMGALMPYIKKVKAGIKYAKEILDVPEAANDIIQAVEDAMEDGNISQAEIKQIVDLAKNLKVQVEQVKELF